MLQAVKFRDVTHIDLDIEPVLDIASHLVGDLLGGILFREMGDGLWVVIRPVVEQPE